MDQLSCDSVIDKLYRVQQSNSNFFINDKLRVRCLVSEIPAGNGMVGLSPGDDIEEFIKQKISIIDMPAFSNLCLPLAIVVALEIRENPDNVKNIKSNRFPRYKWIEFESRARQLCHHSGVVLPANNGFGYEELLNFQQYLNQHYSTNEGNRYRIVVYSDFNGTVYFEGLPPADNVINLNLLLINDHYRVLKSLAATFVCKFFCEFCLKPSSRITDHQCKFKCKSCLNSPPCDKTNNKLNCNLCNRSFYGHDCFARHQSTVCNKLKICASCNKCYTTSGGNQHECGVTYCKLCCTKRPEIHDCFIPTCKPGDKKNIVFCAFDLECVISAPNQDGLSEHYPNLCVSQTFCRNCLHVEEKDYTCNLCGLRERVFLERCFQVGCKGHCLLFDFFEFLFSIIRKGFKVILLSHNGGFYDNQILLKFIMNNISLFHEVPEIVAKGQKIYSIQTKHYKIIDSLNYFGTSLKNLPRMFDFPEEKGFFPYLFNCNENLDYQGSIPEKKFFMPDGMKPNEKLEFELWYDNFMGSGELYNHRQELIKYCSLDVTILRKSLVKFYMFFRDAFDFNIFDCSLTIASCCNKVFRSKFMEADSIGIIPLNGYRLRDNQSLIALKWLYTEEVKRGINIDHAGNGREKKIGKYRVDGFYEDPVTKHVTIYEFNGCYWHACSKCYPHIVSGNDETLEMVKRRENTEERLQYLKSRVHNVISIWECEFRDNLAVDHELSELANNNPYCKIPPLNPREAFYGGRTSTIRKYYKVEPEEAIRYYDVCSLYPYVNKNYKVPLGHPRILVGSEAQSIDIENFEGLLKVLVLPPSNLYHPVLPYRMHNKLLFFLCHKCALERIEVCSHTDSERSFVGTYVSDEIKLAIRHGYKILTIYEAWEYRVEIGIFSKYVNTFLKEKQEASGFPGWCETDAQKLEYIQLYKDREDVDLDPERIEKNPGRRSSAKLCLNSFWGKFGENPMSKTKVEIVSESQRFFEMIMSAVIQITKVVIINDTTLLICYENTVDARENLNTVNVTVAAYTTCGARMQLYSYLEALGRRVLYLDTDSVIFTEKRGETTLALGDYLGDLTDELTEYGPGSYITEFVSGGPKNYAFEVFSPQSNSRKYVVKAKGFTLNSKNLEVINFSSLRDLVLNSVTDFHEFEDDNLVTRGDKIVRRGMGNLYSRHETKVLKLHYDKRREVGEFSTVPWGFK